MLDHDEMVTLQAEHHSMVTVDSFSSEKEYVLYLIHEAAYETGAGVAGGKRVLDLGCNIGYGCAILNKTGQSVTGADVSGQAIDTARKKYADTDMRFEVVDGSASSLEGETFDLATSFQVIEHIVDVSAYLDTLGSLLATDGLAILTTPNASLRLYPGMRPWYRFHVREYTASELKALLEKHFKHVEVYGLFADEPLYSIEKKRVEGSRERGRIKQEKEKQFPYRMTAKLKPLKLAIKKALRLDRRQAERRRKRKQRNQLDASFIERYSTANFYYASEGLENALDLMAICSNDANACRNASEQLNRRDR